MIPERTNVYSVTQVNTYIKQVIARDFALRQIYVKGEVSNCKYHPSGHIYFSLKDSTGVIACVMFSGNRSGLRFPMKDGQKVIAGGSISVYERGGSYQLYAREILLDGQGDLHLRMEELKKKLAEMGMFAAEYKQPIPRFCQRVGIVTASTGAAIRDICNIAHRRNPYVQLILCPAAVQGERAVPEIIRGIETLDAMGLDCIIVGRGGGSIEDLWAFNEEAVARVIFDARTPIISAVGHETDVTIADYVADLRAPTPSAAAELAVFDWYEFRQDLSQKGQRLIRDLENRIGTEKWKLQASRRRLEAASPAAQLENRRQGLVNRQAQLEEMMHSRLRSCSHRLELAASRLEAQSPLAHMKKGYAFLTDGEGHTVLSAGQLQEGDEVTAAMADGILKLRVTETACSDPIHGRWNTNES